MFYCSCDPSIKIKWVAPKRCHTLDACLRVCAHPGCGHLVGGLAALSTQYSPNSLPSAILVAVLALILEVVYATADEAVAYMFYRCFFLFFFRLQKYETTVLGNG